VKLTADVAGDGETVVLLHSTVCDRRMWEPQWPALTAQYRAVRCDLAGYGDTPVPTGSYNNADDVRDLLDDLGAGPVALVGSSGGGRVAIEFAARWPGRVTALALLCTAAPEFTPSDELRRVWAREEELYDAGDVDGVVDLMVATFVGPEATAETRDLVRRMQRRALEVQMAAPQEPEQTAVPVDLGAIRTRCLAVSGAHDLPDFASIAAGLAAGPPRARHVHLPWAGHLPSLERPAEVTALLTDFLG